MSQFSDLVQKYTEPKSIVAALSLFTLSTLELGCKPHAPEKSQASPPQTELSNASFTAVSPSTQKVSAAYLPQSHDVDELEFGTADYEKVALSQYNLAQFIEKQTNLVLVCEGLVNVMTLNSALNSARRESVELTQKTFPKGIPDQFSALSADQKDILVQVSAGPVLLYLGKLPALYPMYTQSENLVTENRIKVLAAYYKMRGEDPYIRSAAYRFLAFDLRELALGHALERAHTVGENVACTFGIGHTVTMGGSLTNRVNFTYPMGIDEVETEKRDPYNQALARLLAIDRREPMQTRLELALREIEMAAKALGL